MLLVDWLQENDFLQFEHTKEWHFFSCLHDYTANDIIQIALNNYSSRYKLLLPFLTMLIGEILKK